MHRIIVTDKAPLPIGPYSQAVIAGDVLYVSGQIGLAPSTAELCSNDVVQQTHQVCRNLIAIIEAAHLTLSDTIKLTVYLTTMDDYTAVNHVLMEYLKEPYPARVAVAVVSLPKMARVEIDAIVGGLS